VDDEKDKAPCRDMWLVEENTKVCSVAGGAAGSRHTRKPGVALKLMKIRVILEVSRIWHKMPRRYI
jgi:hypothetical protein